MKIIDLKYEDMGMLVGKHIGIRSYETGIVVYGKAILQGGTLFIDLSSPPTKKIFGPLNHDDELLEIRS